MRIRLPPPQRSIWNGRDQRKLMYLLGALILVLVCINLAMDPRSWYWLTGPPPADARKVKAAPAGRPVVKGLPGWEDDDSLPDGGFRLPREKPQAEASQPTPPEANSPEPAQTAEAQSPAVATDAELLDTIRDDTLNIRHSEREAYVTLLARARDLPLSTLERESLKDVTFAQIFSDPDLYRGKLITFVGDLRRLVDLGPVSAAPGDETHGIDKVYELWFFTADSGDNPYVVRCTSIPEGIPVGDKLSERIQVTGYFFKRYEYPTARGLHAAPLLLGKRPRWTPAPVAPQTDPAVIPYILGGLALVGTLLAIVVCKFAAGESRQQRTNLQRVREPSRDAIAALSNVEAVDINAVLRELSEADKRTAGEGDDS